MRVGLKIVVVALVVVAGVIGVGVGSFGPVVRATASSKAQAWGVEIQIGEARPGFGRIWLRDVQVRIPDVSAIDIVVDHVEVTLTSSFGVKRVAAHGGTVRVEGTLREVENQVRTWRNGRAGGTTRQVGMVRPISADGVRLTWKEAFGGGESQDAWGVRYERAVDGREVVGADLVRLFRRGVSLELSAPSVEMTRRDGVRTITRIAAKSVAGGVDLGAVSAPKQSRKEGGRAEPAQSDSVDSPGRVFRKQLGRVAAAISQALPADASLELSSLSLDLASHGQTLHVGPARLVLGRDVNRIHLELVPGGIEQQTPLELRMDLPVAKGEVEIELDGGPVSLAALGVEEGSFGLLDVAKTDVSAKGSVTLQREGDRITFSGNSRIERLNIERPRVAAAAMRGLSLGWRGSGALAGDFSRLELEESEVRVGKTRVEVAGELEWSGGQLKLGKIHGGVPLASCQSMISSAPEGLLPLVRNLELGGTFSLQASATFDLTSRAEPKVTWQMANDCRVDSVSKELDPRRFGTRWVREVVGADGRPVTVESGPGTPQWVPLGAISRHMPTAIVICEDARFYRHRGFDQESIASSISDNLNAGKFIRGASTVSMQLAKNLYLARDKTASRKLQEAVLTVLLEQSLTKDQLMELYLNVIEFGPGIYGIGPAAAYYFSSTAGELSLGQSLYLASILPSPRSHHFDSSGAVTDKWLAYLHKLMRIAHKIRRITEAELEEGLQELIVFQQPYHPVELAPGPIDAAVFGQPPLSPPSL